MSDTDTKKNQIADAIMKGIKDALKQQGFDNVRIVNSPDELLKALADSCDCPSCRAERQLSGPMGAALMEVANDNRESLAALREQMRQRSAAMDQSAVGVPTKLAAAQNEIDRIMKDTGDRLKRLLVGLGTPLH